MANIKSGNSKILVLDTSVVIENPYCLEKFANGNNTVVLPYVVIQELDRLKNGSGQRNFSAREITEIILGLSEKGSLLNGVPVGDGGLVKIDCGQFSASKVPDSLDLSKNDDKILATAYNLMKNLPTNESVKLVLLTLDNIMMIKARCLGIEVEDIKDIRVDVRKLHDGAYRELTLKTELMDIIKDKKKISLKEIEYALDEKPLISNEFIVANSNRNYVMRYNDDWLNVIPVPKPVFSVRPIAGSLAQSFAWNLLFDEKIEIATLIGEAGTGKTFLALVSALAQLESFPNCGYEKLYDKIIVITPTVAISEEQDLGFLPGSEAEKIAPWVQAIFDNLKIIRRSSASLCGGVTNSGKIIEELCENGTLEFVNINHIRGRSLANAFIIVDESQNFFCSETKLIGTRPAKGSKIIFTGDPSQVNRRFLRKDNNGLVRVVKAFRGCEEAGVVFLGSGDIVRSRIAQLFAEKF